VITETRPPISDQDTLRGAVRAILRSWLIILLCAAAAVGGSLLYERDESTGYTATALIAFSQEQYQSVVAGGSGAVDAERQLAAAATLIALPDLRARVARAVGPAASRNTTIRPVVNMKASVIGIEATAASPRAAALVANTSADEYLRFRNELSKRNVSAARGRLTRQAADAPTRLERRALLGTRNNLDVARALNANNASIVQRANAPVAQSVTSRKRTALIALALGAVVGIAIALFRGPKVQTPSGRVATDGPAAAAD
jgi:uncharacterized protein involved in exopolysaccharide biosynthesis